MKVLNFGSLNYDYVYEMEHFVVAKETVSSIGYKRNYGGKGLNQSIALAKAGIEVYHAGKVGSDGQDFIDYLNKYNVKTDYLVKDNNEATGHAIIQVCNGENCIILHGGANQKIDEKQVEETLANFNAGDLLLVQNEISSMSAIIKKAHDRGMKIAFNTAPMDGKIFTYPLELVDIFIVNEVEAKGLAKANSDDISEIIKSLQDIYPTKQIVLTVGENGAYYISGNIVEYQEAINVKAVDTTAAGDTFTGFFLSSYLNGASPKEALQLATKASSITVQGEGAAQSIPELKDIQ